MECMTLVSLSTLHPVFDLGLYPYSQPTLRLRQLQGGLSHVTWFPTDTPSWHGAPEATAVGSTTGSG